MSQQFAPDYGAAATRATYGPTSGPVVRGTWAGLTAFASTVMVLVGGFHALAGLTALVGDDFAVDTEGYLFGFDTTTWGWVHLVLGTLLVASGIALFTGAIWARAVGTLAAGVTALAAFLWLPLYPLWGALVLVLSIVVILAVTVHGRDLSRLD
jgi:hypothetical protein